MYLQKEHVKNVIETAVQDIKKEPNLIIAIIFAKNVVVNNFIELF